MYERRLCLIAALAISLSACNGEVIDEEPFFQRVTVIEKHYTAPSGGGVGFTTGGNVAFTGGSGSKYNWVIEYEQDGTRDIVSVYKDQWLSTSEGTQYDIPCVRTRYASGHVSTWCERDERRWIR